MDIGLTSAIINIGAIIVGAAFSNDYFGLYPISAIIVRKCMISVANPLYSRPLERFLQGTLRKEFQIHQQNPRLFFESDTDDILAQYLGTGAYSQIASTTFAIKFHVMSKTNASGFALYDEQRLFYQKLAVKCKSWEHVKTFKWNFQVSSDYTPIIESRSRFPQESITKTFNLKEGERISIGIYVHYPRHFIC